MVGFLHTVMEFRGVFVSFWWNRVYRSATVRCGLTFKAVSFRRLGGVSLHSKVPDEVIEAVETGNLARN